MPQLNTSQITEGTLLWEPSPEFQQASVMADYMRWLAEHKHLHFTDYHALWRWSVDDLDAFWASVPEFFGVAFAQPWRRVLADRRMPGARWFEGATLNYAANIFRNASDNRPAAMAQSETRPLQELSWADLRQQVASVAAWLRSRGVGTGDRVVAYMPNLPETLVACLATASLGAIWSSCSPDFGVGAVLDRFTQIEPKVLFAVDGYTYSGKPFDRRGIVAELQQGLPTLQDTVMLPYLETGAPQRPVTWWQDVAGRAGEQLDFEAVPFDHPLWVVYSSGTTGLPKALVHGHGGIVLEHVKVLGLHTNVRPGDRIFWYSSTGWMMWNFIVGGLLVGGVPVLYDGSTAYPSMDVLWQLAQDARFSLFGTSAAYIGACLKADLHPGARFDLSALQSVGSTGSPLPPEGFAWVYARLKPDIWLASISGGTDVASAFVGGCPLLPVRAGELQCRALGARVEAYDDRGQPVINQTGELVVTEPMPSMPVFLWNDPDGSRYRASYFEMFPGVWRHGDWIKLTESGSAIIQGRSDATLNRLGVRIGTAEVYSAVESLPEVTDSLVIGLELPGGGYYMPLFVALANGVELDDALIGRINTTLRTMCSPRHVPDEVVAVPGIPRTLSDKKMEVPVKKLFMGVPIEQAAKADATKDPQLLEHFAALAHQRSPLLHR